ncbi:alpha-2-macroglobulin family protein [Synechocystis sp. PCC 7509]|uniref:alpha-2-macroglobulin family protein n=1 Tax=Synechocystis sp. PCC 7509 TaxID=927677 RepID=UPI0002AC1D62|nr:alpha-2-macroglobulin [Synechocystis sp. PCC 7509]
MRAIFKRGIQVLLAVFILLGVASCNVANLSGNEPLPMVSALPSPQLPDWIEQISPVGESEVRSQIRIRFKDALIPVESIDSPNQQQILEKIAIFPPLKGQFRFLTPRLVGFQSESALPKATRVQVTLKAGLADLKNHRLEQDLAWTFNTEAIKLTNLPGMTESGEVEPIDIKPNLKLTSNVELDINSLKERLKLINEGGKENISFDVTLDEQDKSAYIEPENKFDPSTRNWIYSLKPRQTLTKATTYRWEAASGLRPLNGNLPSTMPFTSKVVTYAPLTFEKLNFIGQPDSGGTSGRFTTGSAQLQFNNPLVASSSEDISVTPAPKKTPRLVQVYENDRIVNLNPYAIEPETTYTITLGANVKDTFGQTLGKPVTVKYQTGDLAGDIWIPSDLNIFPSGKDLQLNISTINLPESRYKAAYQVVQPTDLVYADSAYPQGEGKDLLPTPDNWQSFKVSGKKNQYKDIAVPLKEKLSAATGMLAYGVQARTNSYQDVGKQKWRDSTNYGLVQLTNLGVFAQWFPDSGIVRVHHLSDGAVVSDASVEIYQSKLEAKSRTLPQPCAIAQTDITGTVLFNRQALQQCYTSSEDAPKLLAIIRESNDWAFARSSEYSGAYDFGIDAGWDSGKPQSRGIVFSDRQLYQPGEKAWFTGMAYHLQNGALRQDKNTVYKVTLEDPEGKKTDLGSQTTNEFGTFSLEYAIAPNKALGYYNIQAKSSNGAEITGDFRIAQFKPPNFKVDLTLDKDFVAIGEKVTANASSSYLFGSPVEGGKVQYYVTRQQTDFTPQKWDKFSFGRKWFWPEEAPEITTDVLQSEQILDNAGKSSQIVPVAKDVPYPMSYRVDAQVTDVSNLSVANSKTFTVLPSEALIGLQSNFVTDAGKTLPVQVIVTDNAGNAIAGKSVSLELQQIIYSSVTQVIEGSQTPKNQVEYKTVEKTKITSAQTPQTVSLTPSESGSYRIQANFADAKNDVTATDTQIWAAGNSPVDWGNKYRNNRLELRLDKETYKPGETATVLIQSPYPEGELHFAIIRHNFIERRIVPVIGAAPQIQFQVTADMLPNAAVEAVLVRQGEPLAQVEPGKLDKLVRVGFAPFKTNLDDKYLNVQAKATNQSLQPGAEQTLQLEMMDRENKPIQGQFTVMVVNEAVLQLSGYRVPDLVSTVYAEQPISTRFADNRPDVVLQPLSSPLQKGWGYGGGLSNSAASTRIRENFQALAYYNGSVLTDAEGKANITFKLPDNLTTWRVMVVATDGNLNFGNGETTFITTKPLLTNPVLPQFVRPGDRFEGGLSVTNNTGQSANLAIKGNLSGGVGFANNSGSQNIASETGTRAYRFPMVANTTGNTQVQFTTQLNNETDAFNVPLDVRQLKVTEQVVETGVTDKQVKIPLNIAKNVVNDTGGLEISVASTLIAQITAPAKQVLGDDELPFLEPAASKLAIASNLTYLSQTYNQKLADFNPQQQASQALARLQTLQKPDGGFASFPNQELSDPFVSAYAAQSLAQAIEVGIPVNSAMVSRLESYLAKLLANPSQYDYCKQQLCKNQLRLEALIALGNKRTDFLADIYEYRSNFDYVTQIKLARYLSQFPQWQEEFKVFFDQLQETVSQTGRNATVNLPPNWKWLNSPTTAQAQVLRLFVAQKSSPEVLDRVLQGLLSLRRGGTWSTTYDNAEALTALVEYSQIQPQPQNLKATVQLANKQLGQAQLTKDRLSLNVQVPIAKLPRGKQDLILKKSGKGLLHYLVAYRYRLQGNQSGALNGLRVVREIRAANNNQILRRFGLYDTKEPLKVSTGQVFDIGLEITTDHPVNNIVITDPIPAGFEAVDTSFQTATPYFQAGQDSWEIDYKNIYSDRIVAYSNSYNAGVYTLHYLVRSVTPGTFLYPGAEVHLQYAPEEFGRSADSTLQIVSN